MKRIPLFQSWAVAVLLAANILPCLAQSDGVINFKAHGNPIVTTKFTADPAPLVIGDTLWLYTGHDSGGRQRG